MGRPASTLFVLLPKFVMLLLFCDFHSTGTAVLADDVTVTVDVTITDVDNTSCISASSLPVTVLVEYRLLNTLTSTPEFTDPLQQWRTLNTTSTGENFMVFTIDSEVRGVQFRLLQLQHNGTDCSCWQLDKLTVAIGSASIHMFDPSNICHSQLFQENSQNFCDGDRNEARGLITTALNDNFGVAISECPGHSNETLFPETMHCDASFPRSGVELPYLLHFGVAGCDGIMGQEEAIELATRTDQDPEWIPLRMIFRHSGNQSVSTAMRVRGHTVPAFGLTESIMTYQDSISVCGERLRCADTIQFRFQQNSTVEGGENDFWGINITMVTVFGQITSINNDIMTHCFADECQASSIDMNTFCSDGNSQHSRTITAFLTPYITLMPEDQSTMSPNGSNNNLFNDHNQPRLQATLASIRSRINSTERLREIRNANPIVALTKLQGLEGERQGVILYLLANALNNFNRSAVSQQMIEIFLEAYLNVTNQIITSDVPIAEERQEVVGSSLLTALDRLAFEALTDTFNRSAGNLC